MWGAISINKVAPRSYASRFILPMFTGIPAVSLLPTAILFPMSSKQSKQAISAHPLPHCEQGLDASVACIVRALPEAKLTTRCVGWPH